MNISDVCSEESTTNRDAHVHAKKKLMVLIDNGDGAASKEGVKTNSSFLHSVINMSAILIGLGQLSTPYALQKGGWASSFLLVGFGILCAYTSHLLGKCLQRNEKIRNYADVGNHAFGAKGKIVASTFTYLEVFMALVSFTIALNDNLATVFAAKHLNISWTHLSTPQFLTVAAVVVALPTVWLKDLSKISFLSTVGIISSFLIFSSVIYIAVFGGVSANRSIPVLQLRNVPAISGLYVFSFSTHVVFPDIYRSMKDPSKFTKVSVVSFAIVTIFYTTIAFVGAKLFGSQVNSQVTLNMPKHLIVTKMALWATVLAPLTKYAFALVPIASQYDRKLPSSVSSRTRLFIRGTIGSMLLIFVLILALAVPHFEQVLGLTGSLVSICVSIIFPCAFYSKMFWSQISNPSLVLNVTLIVIASILGVLELAYSLKVTEKSDVYSFGVVLLELVTGKSPVEAVFGEERDIVYWGSTHLNSLEDTVKVLDHRVSNSIEDEIIKVLRIAILCTTKLPNLRPNMREVVKMLVDSDPCYASNTEKIQEKC